MLQSICQQTWKTQQWSQNWKTSVFITTPKKDNAKECPSPCSTVLISLASKVILKMLQARPHQYVNWESPAVLSGFRKGRETRDQIDNIPWIIEKARGFQKEKKKKNCQHPLDHQKSKRVPEKPLLLLYWLRQSVCVDHNRLWKIFREMGVPECLTCFFRNLCMKVKKQQLEMDMKE